jgi:hypothetical protein
LDGVIGDRWGMCLACIMEVVIKIEGCLVHIHELHYPIIKGHGENIFIHHEVVHCVMLPFGGIDTLLLNWIFDFEVLFMNIKLSKSFLFNSTM